MKEILEILNAYRGSGTLLILYLGALIYLAVKEKNKGKRIVMVILPALILLVFLMPPVYSLYCSLDSADTYYRFLWMIPMSLTIAYAGMVLFQQHLVAGVCIVCALILVAGQYVYQSESILKAENRLHLPQMVLDVSDFLMNETQGERTVVAMPEALAQYVRQYNAMIVMPFGREMLMDDYYNSVYEAMEQTDPVEAKTLCESLDEYDCEYLVLETTKVLSMDGDLTDYGLVFLADIDGYSIYHCPYWDEAEEAYEEYMKSLNLDS